MIFRRGTRSFSRDDEAHDIRECHVIVLVPLVEPTGSASFTLFEAVCRALTGTIGMRQDGSLQLLDLKPSNPDLKAKLQTSKKDGHDCRKGTGRDPREDCNEPLDGTGSQ